MIKREGFENVGGIVSAVSRSRSIDWRKENEVVNEVFGYKGSFEVGERGLRVVSGIGIGRDMRLDGGYIRMMSGGREIVGDNVKEDYKKRIRLRSIVQEGTLRKGVSCLIHNRVEISDVWFLMIRSIRNYVFEYSGCQKVSRDFYEKRGGGYEVRDGDICIACGGNLSFGRDAVKVALIDGVGDTIVLLSDCVFLIRLKDDSVYTKEFLYWWFRSRWFQNWGNAVRKSIGIPKIGLFDLGNLWLPGVDLDEQDRLVAEVRVRLGLL